MRWGPDLEAEKAEKTAKEAAKKQAAKDAKATGAAPGSEVRPQVAPSAQPKALPIEAGKKIPEWKRRCIDLYVRCQDEGWTGNCYDCFRYCEGQQQWPDDKCHRQTQR